MNIGVVGVNHNLAPINVREAVSFTDTKKIEAINILLDREIDEIVILSTCNRSEIYISGENIQQKVDEVANFYKDYFGVKDIEQYLFKKTNLEAIQHLFDVTAGLDSLVVGEDQILGQVKDAHEFCMKLGATKKVFNKLFRDAVTTSKEIKTITKISQQPLSISYIGVKLLKEKMGTLEGKNALIVGLGKMNLLTLNHLEEENVKNIYIANRNIEKTKEIENKFDNIIPIEYSDRHKIIQEKSIDIVISATSSPHLVIKYDDMPKLDKKIYIMDIALPRDIDTKLKELNYEGYVIATGASSTRKLNVPGNEYAINAVDFLANNMPCNNQVAIIGGGLTGCEIAYELALQGKHPFIIEMADDILKVPGSCMANTSFLRDAFKFYNVPIYTLAKTIAILPDAVFIENNNGHKKQLNCDTIVTSIGYVNEKSFEKKNNVHIIGDADKVANLKHAIWQANDLAVRI